MKRPLSSSPRGFTLVEMVIVIVITGIVAAAIAVFIKMPVQGYVDSEARAEAADIADTALRRIARDVRLALPNSVRVASAGNVRYLEFLITKTGARYLSEEENPTSGKALSFAGASATPNQFDVVGPMPSGAQAIAKDDYVVVYNLGPGFSPADAYGDCAAGCNIAKVAALPVGNTITLTGNPFLAQSPKMTSPNHRFQVVTGPVSYVCDLAAGTLTRVWGYPITANQPTPPVGGSSALLASGVTACEFSYGNVAGQRTGLAGLLLAVRAPGSGSGTISLFHQIHVDNMP